jgi:hypothetical protein
VGRCGRVEWLHRCRKRWIEIGPVYRAGRRVTCPIVRGRSAHCWPPPAQIRTCGFPAYGSYLGCLTAKRTFGEDKGSSPSPFAVRLVVRVSAPVTRLPGPAPAACFADLRSPWSSSLAPPAPLRPAPLCSLASQLLRQGQTSRARVSPAAAPRLPDADPRCPTAGQTRDLPGSDAILSSAMSSSTAAGRRRLA